MKSLAILLAALLLGACAPRQLIVSHLADELAGQASAAEDDLELARDASPFYLKLSEAVLRRDPAHAGLAEALAGGFAQYAYAFVAFDAERLESRDAAGAEQLRRRAARLYARARGHALKALDAAHPGFEAALGDPARRLALSPGEVGLAYWAAAAWGGQISLSKDDPETVADFPLALRLATLAWDTDPDWGEGSLASLMGSFEAARPGGKPARALAWFDRGIALGAGRNPGALLAKAEGHAQPAGDRALFEALLAAALETREPAGSPATLRNQVMRRRAAWLAAHTDELF